MTYFVNSLSLSLYLSVCVCVSVCVRACVCERVRVSIYRGIHRQYKCSQKNGEIAFVSFSGLPLAGVLCENQPEVGLYVQQ